MSWKNLWLGLVMTASGAASAIGQTPTPQPAPANTPAPVYAPYTPANVGGSVPSASNAAPGTAGEAGQQPFDPVGRDQPAQETAKPGPTPVREVGLITDTLGTRNLFGDTGLLIFGWLDGGYTYASTGSGLLNVEPRENRFGNQFLANQLAIAVEKPLSKTDWDIGFKAIYFAGADAALLHPLGGFPVTDDKFGHDFRDLYLSFHAPVLTEGGIDVQVGRMTTPIGYTGALAPFRTFYSNDYQWFYAQDGAWTGVLTTTHVNKQLDILAGVTLGANTFFRTRANGSYCGIGQVNYWLTEEKKTLLTASVHFGRNAIFPTVPVLDGDDVMVEARVFQVWSKYFDQVVQLNMGWRDTNGVQTGEFYGVYTIGMFHLSQCLDFNARAEWFNDVSGNRTGIKNNYEEFTLGLNWHPVKYLEIRPEARYDLANDNPAFGTPGNGLRRSQFTAAIECLIKF